MNEYKTGWIPDYPDYRDYGPEHHEISGALSIFRSLDSDSEIPDCADLRPYFGPIRDQGHLNSCTAHSGTDLAEYYVRRVTGVTAHFSRLFLYKTTRNLLKTTQDNGAYARTTMGAMALFGLPPEEYWPYDPALVNEEPTAFVYALAQSFQAVRYYRIDDVHSTAAELLIKVKKFIYTGFPLMFGFSLFNSIVVADKTGKIPHPGAKDKLISGHTVVAVGYDDEIVIERVDGNKTKGALIIRNHWGAQWGDQGYGYLPYQYVLDGMAVDWWSLLSNEWIDSGQFTP
jgi:C1A family cysteine protease